MMPLIVNINPSPVFLNGYAPPTVVVVVALAQLPPRLRALGGKDRHRPMLLPLRYL